MSDALRESRADGLEVQLEEALKQLAAATVPCIVSQGQVIDAAELAVVDACLRFGLQALGVSVDDAKLQTVQELRDTLATTVEELDLTRRERAVKLKERAEAWQPLQSEDGAPFGAWWSAVQRGAAAHAAETAEQAMLLCEHVAGGCNGVLQTTCATLRACQAALLREGDRARGGVPEGVVRLRDAGAAELTRLGASWLLRCRHLQQVLPAHPAQHPSPALLRGDGQARALALELMRNDQLDGASVLLRAYLQRVEQVLRGYTALALCRACVL